MDSRLSETPREEQNDDDDQNDSELEREWLCLVNALNTVARPRAELLTSAIVKQLVPYQAVVAASD
jgi:hypothetical protein